MSVFPCTDAILDSRASEHKILTSAFEDTFPISIDRLSTPVMHFSIPENRISPLSLLLRTKERASIFNTL